MFLYYMCHFSLNRNAKLNSAYLKVKSEVDELNAERIHHALQISDKIDELNLRTEEVAHL